VVSHVAGDFLLQTEWQAVHKFSGLGRDPVARRALFAHVATYTLAFAPALAWLAVENGARVIGAAFVIAVPHLIQDDGRLLRAYVKRVKRSPNASELLHLTVDQSFHAVGLLAAALAAAA
jgi:hypothetical protein